MKKKASPTDKLFEVDMVVYNSKGKPIGRKTYSTDSSHKLWQFWNQHHQPNKRKSKKRGDKGATNAKDAAKILGTINKDKETE